jgi:hypothetical protein
MRLLVLSLFAFTLLWSSSCQRDGNVAPSHENNSRKSLSSQSQSPDTNLILSKFSLSGFVWSNNNTKLVVNSSNTLFSTVIAELTVNSNNSTSVIIYTGSQNTCYKITYTTGSHFLQVASSLANLQANIFSSSRELVDNNLFIIDENKFEDLATEIGFLLVTNPGVTPVTITNPPSVMWKVEMKCEKGESQQNCMKRAINNLCGQHPEKCDESNWALRYRNRVVIITG